MIAMGKRRLSPLPIHRKARLLVFLEADWSDMPAADALSERRIGASSKASGRPARVSPRLQFVWRFLSGGAS
jgi:hypothetical protein